MESLLTLGVPEVWDSGGWSIEITAFTQSLGSELISNGTMETGDPPTNWLAGANAVLSSQADERTGGSGSACLQVLEDPTGSSNYGQYNLTSLTGGAWYLGQMWLRNVDTALGCYLQWADDVNLSSPAAAPFITGTDWMPIYHLRRLPDARTTAFFRARGSGNVSQSFRADDASCKRVNLNTHQSMPSADMQIEIDFTLPGSPISYDQVCLYYRVTDTLEAAAQFWRARLIRNLANTGWDFALHLVNGNTETQKILIQDVGDPDGIRVKIIGNEHRCYTRESSVWTQRGSAITDATYNDQTGVNVINTPGITLTALRGESPSPF